MLTVKGGTAILATDVDDSLGAARVAIDPGSEVIHLAIDGYGVQRACGCIGNPFFFVERRKLFSQADNVAGIQLMTEMLLTGAVLAVGLLLADNIWPLLFSRRTDATVSETKP